MQIGGTVVERSVRLTLQSSLRLLAGLFHGRPDRFQILGCACK